MPKRCGAWSTKSLRHYAQKRSTWNNSDEWAKENVSGSDSSLGAIRALTNICRWFPAVLGGSTSVLPESLIDQLVGIL